MRVLFIAPYVPSLIRVRPYHFIRRLSELGHQITVVALGADGAASDQAARTALLPFCRAVHVVSFSRAEAALHCLGSLPTPTPLWAAYCFSRGMEQALRRILSDEKFDIAHVEHLRAAHFADVLSGRLPLVFDSVDCITDLQRQLMHAPGRSLLARAVSWEEQAKLRYYEPKTAARFSRVLITSTPDAKALQLLATDRGLTLPIDVLPNGVDLDYFSPQPDVRPTSASLVLTGKMSYAANEDAALYFCRDIFPLVRRECPNATLTIAGSGPGPALLALAKSDDAITVTGRVDDLRPYFARAAVAVCPLRIGVGIQNKALEAMAMGKAVVTTPLVARALTGDVVSVADGPAQFASQVVDLLADPVKATRLGQDARAYVETHHDWRRAARRLGEIYASLL
jgi:sugar transferase (PEP-CTERM/EpsH1 system associated)